MREHRAKPAEPDVSESRIERAATVITGLRGRPLTIGIWIPLALASVAFGAPSPLAGVPSERPAAKPGDGFRGTVERLSPELRRRMTGVSWHEGCPVGLGDLRLVRATHLGFDGRPDRGAIVVHERHARGMLDVLRRLWATRFPIRRMELIDRYGGDDHRSIAAGPVAAAPGHDLRR